MTLDYYKRQEERRAKLLAQDPVEYTNRQPVYSEDTERYYPDLDTLIDEYWDESLSYETALVFECRTELAATPDLVEYVEERWYEEIEDGYDMEMPPAARTLLEEVQKQIAPMAPVVWYPDYKRRLEFDYSGYPEVGDNV
jgi:hypothetical protein